MSQQFITVVPHQHDVPDSIGLPGQMHLSFSSSHRIRLHSSRKLETADALRRAPSRLPHDISAEYGRFHPARQSASVQSHSTHAQPKPQADIPVLFHVLLLEVRRPARQPGRNCCTCSEAAPKPPPHRRLRSLSKPRQAANSAVANRRHEDLHQTLTRVRVRGRPTHMLPAAVHFSAQQRYHPQLFAYPESARSLWPSARISHAA